MKTKLLSASVISVSALSASPAIATENSVPKPNFVFIITDDQRWDAMGVVQKEQGEKARFPWFESPAMDRLASEGVRFRNAFVTLSLCSPSRAAFLTGQYAHVNGIRKNNRGLPLNSVTHATLLRDAGYQTAYFGKWHMRHQKERPGYDYYASFIGQGKYQDWDFQVNGKTTPTKGWIDDVSTTFAIDWLKANHKKPFSMVLGFKSPHNHRGGENLPERLRNLYVDKKGRPAPNMKTLAPFMPPMPDGVFKPHRFVANEAQLDYFRHIKGIDENLGRLLDAIDECGIAEDTVVVFTSDNGYFLGEHNLGDKRALYEESIRIPMIARYPRKFKRGLYLTRWF
jgi:arylsulfatase A-like enzyme